MTGNLFDTNVISETMTPQPDKRVVRWLEQQHRRTCFTSVIVLGEIRRGAALAPSDLRRSILDDWFARSVLPLFEGRILPVNRAIAERWGDLSAQMKQKGIALSESDGLIAATALVHDLTVVTRNTKDFARTGVRLLNPWDL